MTWHMREDTDRPSPTVAEERRGLPLQEDMEVRHTSSIPRRRSSTVATTMATDMTITTTVAMGRAMGTRTRTLTTLRALRHRTPTATTAPQDRADGRSLLGLVVQALPLLVPPLVGTWIDPRCRALIQAVGSDKCHPSSRPC